MGKRNKKYGTIHLNAKPVWEVSRGHSDHISGSGTHDNRPKRQRTRGDANRKAMRDYD